MNQAKSYIYPNDSMYIFLRFYSVNNYMTNKQHNLGFIMF